MTDLECHTYLRRSDALRDVFRVSITNSNNDIIGLCVCVQGFEYRFDDVS